MTGSMELLDEFILQVFKEHCPNPRPVSREKEGCQRNQAMSSVS